MIATRSLRRAAVLACATSLLLVLPSAAGAAQQSNQQRLQAKQAAVAKQRARQRADTAPFTSAGGLMGAATDVMVSPGHQHGSEEGHLPPTRKNVELIGKLEPTKQFGDIVPGQIADLAVYKQTAYLNSWLEPTCTRGGTYVVDIEKPAKPREIGFIPALAGNYHGEGAQVITVKTEKFTGDLLAVNNEICGEDVTRGGGFDLYDVSKPRRPKVLVRGFGDFGGEGFMTGDRTVANQYHSVFVWKDGGKVYLVASDDEELHDVDIFDITNPRQPEPVDEFDLAAEFPQIVDNSALGNLIFNHDMVVKEINGHQIMLLSNWDAGYVKLNVDDPFNPEYLADSSFDGPDPLTGLEPPEGNAHQAEFSFDNRFILAADEDFNPYRAGEFSITSGPNMGQFESAEVGGGLSAASLPDLTLNGPTVYGGYGCPASRPVPQRSAYDLELEPGEEAILVLQRGPTGDPNAPEEACFPGEKAAQAAAAGWDAVLLVNRHLGSADADEPFCGSGGFPAGVEMVTLCTTHEAFHAIFNAMPPIYTGGSLDAPGEPAFGAVGADIEGQSVFDGWGYAHLYRNNNGKLQEIDAYAIPEALDPDFAFGFGDLSIHEFATEPRRRVAYSSYYSGGMRVFVFGSGGLKEVGRFIDQGGNNFWGVETFRSQKYGRLFAGSDRDFGLYILRYTG